MVSPTLPFPIHWQLNGRAIPRHDPDTNHRWRGRPSAVDAIEHRRPQTLIEPPVGVAPQIAG